MVKKGEQSVVLKILDGPYEGRIVEGLNQLLGQMDRDKIFSPNNVALVVLSLDEKGEIVFVNPQAHYRLGHVAHLRPAFAVERHLCAARLMPEHAGQCSRNNFV